MRNLPLSFFLVLRAIPASIDASEVEKGIALLFIRGFSFDTNVHDMDNEQFVIDCIRRTLRNRHPDIPILDIEALQAKVFPHLPVSAVPRQPKYMDILLREDEFRRQMGQHGIQYIAYVGGVSETQQEGGGFCVGGYAGAACFVFAEWHEKARLGATVVDLRDISRTDRLRSQSEDTAWFALIGIVPVGMPSNAEDQTCRDVGVQISEYLNARSR
jgi:hypothetical protein